MKPRSVAVFGAGADPNNIGHRVLANLHAAEFAGPIYPVNPHHATIAGMPAFGSAADLPAAPDVSVIVTPPDSVAGVVRDAAERGCRAGIVITAGFGEGGAEEGIRRRSAVLAAARPYLFRLLGPNCLGAMSPHAGFNASFSRSSPLPGSLALVTQSGAIAAGMVDWASAQGIGFSHIVSLGDMIDVDFGDVLDYLATDPTTKAILMYVEGITHARKFMSAARAAARIKPVLAVKSGRHDASAHVTASHTGALAGSDAIYDAVFRRAGILRVEDLDDLFDVAALVATARQVEGDRLGIVTNGGGLAALAADRLVADGGRLAALAPATLARLDGVLPSTWSRSNPIDLIGDAGVDKYITATEAVAADPGVDAILVMHCPTAAADPAVVAEGVTLCATNKPLLTAWVGEVSVGTARNRLMAARIPTFRTPAEAVTAFSDLVRYRKLRQLLLETPAAERELSVEAREKARRLIAAASVGWLPAVRARELLGLYGIACVSAVEARSPAEAASAARALGKTVALKVRSRDIPHKSDIGGVVLGLQAGEVESAAAAMLTRIGRARPNAAIDGFTVECMAVRPHAREFFLGVVRDPVFGPAIAVGHGGTAVEVIDDKCFGFPPLNEALAGDMISRTRIGRLLPGYRDQPAADSDALLRALTNLAQLASDHPQIAELDINPLLVDEAGVLAVDVRVRIDAGGGAPPIIAPYPRELEHEIFVADIGTLVKRPVRPGDAARVEAFLNRLTPDGRRFRFFSTRGVDHAGAARLTQIDYDRELAFVIINPGSGEVLGFAAFHADPDNQRAEFAVAVRPDVEGRGLGRLLTENLMKAARARGIGAISGAVMASNGRMLALCRRLGMSAAPADGDVITVSKTLERVD